MSPGYCASFESVVAGYPEIIVRGAIECGSEVDDSILEFFETLSALAASFVKKSMLGAFALKFP